MTPLDLVYHIYPCTNHIVVFLVLIPTPFTSYLLTPFTNSCHQTSYIKHSYTTHHTPHICTSNTHTPHPCITSRDSASNGSLSEGSDSLVRALVDSWGGTASATITAGGVDTWIEQQQQQQLEQLQRQRYHQQQQAMMEVKKKEQQFAALSQRQKRSHLAKQSTLSTTVDVTITSTTLLPTFDDDGIPQIPEEQEGAMLVDKSGGMEVVSSHNNLNMFLGNSDSNSGVSLSLPATAPVLSTAALRVCIGSVR